MASPACWCSAGGNLNIYGSINDGFGPPESPDDAGWQLVQGRLGSQGITAFGDRWCRSAASLEAGTMFPTGSKLNYDLPVAPVTLPAGTVLPVAMTLDAALSPPAGLVTGDVTAADGARCAPAPCWPASSSSRRARNWAPVSSGGAVRHHRAAVGSRAARADHAGAGLADPVADPCCWAGARPGGPDGRGWALAPMARAPAPDADRGGAPTGRRAHAQRPEQGRSGDVRHALRPGGPGTETSRPSLSA